MCIRHFCVSIMVVMISVLPASALQMNPGNYEIVATAEMPGMPGGMPPQTMRQCLTEADPVPDASAGAQGCKVTDMKTEGDTVSYTMECNQQGMQMKTTGTMTFRGDTFEGTSQTDMGPSAGGMVVTTKISGKRIGNCE